jgi:histidine ammonia-lyase
VVAAELLCGAQGLEFLKPLKPGAGVDRLHRKLRGLTPKVAPLGPDRPPAPDLERLARAVAAGELDPGD